MPEAVTMSRLMMMTSIVSEESLARDRQTDRQANRQTDRQTDRQAGRQANKQTDIVLTSSILSFFKVVGEFENKREFSSWTGWCHVGFTSVGVSLV